MLIRSRMGVSADGYVSTDEGVPTIAVMPGFEPRVSHGFPEFIQECDAVPSRSSPTVNPAAGPCSRCWTSAHGPTRSRRYRLARA